MSKIPQNLNTRNLVNIKEDSFWSYYLNWLKGLQGKEVYQIHSRKDFLGGFQSKITLIVIDNHALNTRKNTTIGRIIIFTYSYNEVKDLQ